jgi:hypothetical protein
MPADASRIEESVIPVHPRRARHISPLQSDQTDIVEGGLKHQRQPNNEFCSSTLVRAALDGDGSTGGLDNLTCNRQAKSATSTPRIAHTSIVKSAETRKDTLSVMFVDSCAIIDNVDFGELAIDLQSDFDR